MKSSVAAFLIALKEVIEEEELSCSFVLLITSDEEGHAEYGTKELLKGLLKITKLLTTVSLVSPLPIWWVIL